MDDFFSTEELAHLREHGIVIFADRVIFDARAPITAEQLAAVEAACIGPVPPPLLTLWQQAAGGALDYDLSLPMNDSEETIHFAELFGHGEQGFDNLPGWIAHERTRAAERSGAGPTWQPKLAALPFGGFEDSDRLYAITEPGAQFGHILAWRGGQPGAWSHAMAQDGLATVATDLYGALAALHLSEDPLDTPAGEYATGQALLDYLDERHGDHGLDLDLSDKVVTFYRRAIVGWRAPLAEGRLKESPLAAQIALRHAIATDDAGLVDELAAAGLRFDAPLHGSAIPVDLAVAHGAHAAAAALVEVGAPVGASALDAIEGAISPELTRQLLAGGAQPSTQALAQCVACGAPDAGRLIAQAYGTEHDDLPEAFEAARDELLTELEGALAEVREGALVHHLGAEGLAERIEHLRSFQL